MLQLLIVCTQSGSLVIADTGATDHMTPHKSAFISYKAVENLQVRMGNNSYVPVLGCGTAIFSLNGQRILVRNVLHVPGLAVPLYNLCTHLKQRGCGFIGTFEAGMLVYFPTFILLVDTSTDCHLSYERLGPRAPLSTLHYVQPWCTPNLYPSEVSPSTCMVTPVPALAIVEDDERLLMDAPQIPVHSSPALPSTPGGLSMDVLSIAVQLWALADMVTSLMSSPLATSDRLPPSLCSSTSGSSPTTHDAPDVTLDHISLLLAMPQESIINYSTMKVPSFLPFVRATLLTTLKAKHFGRLKEFTASWAVLSFGIISISCRSAVAVNGWMVVNSHPLLGLLQQSLNQIAVGL
jgi:hypothetical protein